MDKPSRIVLILFVLLMTCLFVAVSWIDSWGFATNNRPKPRYPMLNFYDTGDRQQNAYQIWYHQLKVREYHRDLDQWEDREVELQERRDELDTLIHDTFDDGGQGDSFVDFLNE